MFPISHFCITVRSIFVHGTNLKWGLRSVAIRRIIIKDEFHCILNNISSSAFFCLNCSDLAFSHRCHFPLLIHDSCALHVYHCEVFAIFVFSFSCCLTCSYLTLFPWSLCDLQIISISVVHLWPSVHLLLAIFAPSFQFVSCVALQMH